MEFQILSHAGVKVQCDGYQLLCDPWLIGSCHWRSWWNYPPVAKELVNSLKPDCIYLTHIHWDHFHGPSLKKFNKNTQIVIPRAPDTRILDDLHEMGFANVKELKHGETLALTANCKITSWHFGIFLDSALVIEGDGVVLLNANDSKFMGAPLKQILRRHPKIDFVFRSHSAANSRASYEIVDATEKFLDDPEKSIAGFADFVKATGATYAIPFASNHCFLHRESYPFNDIIQTPLRVAEYFKRRQIQHPELRVMVSGDKWSQKGGFQIQAQDYFIHRAEHLARYQDQQAEVLGDYYRKEALVRVSLLEMQEYFRRFCRAIPWLMRLPLRKSELLFVLHSGAKTKSIFAVQLYSGKVRELSEYVDSDFPLQILTSSLMVKMSLRLRMLSHLGSSKRVRYVVTKTHLKTMRYFSLLTNAYDYDWLPLSVALNRRTLQSLSTRWREIVLYFQLVADLLVKKQLDFSRYLPTRYEVDEPGSKGQPNIGIGS